MIRAMSKDTGESGKMERSTAQAFVTIRMASKDTMENGKKDFAARALNSTRAALNATIESGSRRVCFEIIDTK